VAAAQGWRRRRLAQLREIAASSGDLESVSDAVHGAAEGGAYELLRAVYRTIVLSHLSGRWDASPDGPLGYAGDDPFSMPFDEAVAWFRGRQAVTDAEFAQLSTSAAERAFRVAGVTDRRVLDAMHGSLERAIEEGGTLNEWVAELDDKLDVLGVEPFGLHHLDVIFANAVGDAYAGGRYVQMKAVAEKRPFWRYTTADDTHVRPAHAAMHGKVARHDHPLWDRWYPPNGHRCRCDVESLTADDVGPDALEPQLPQVDPDRGWSRSPARAAAADDAGREWRESTADQLSSAPLTGLTVPPHRAVQNLRRRDLDALHQAAMAGLDREGDRARLGRIRRTLNVSDEQLVGWFGDHRAGLLVPGGLQVPRSGVALELALPAQNVAAVEELVRRLARADLRAEISLRWQASLERGQSGRPRSVQVLDPGLAERLGDPAPVRWTSQTVVRFSVAGEQADELARWLLEEAQQGGSRPPIPFSPTRAALWALGPGADEIKALSPSQGFQSEPKQAVTAAVSAPSILSAWEPIPIGINLER